MDYKNKMAKAMAESDINSLSKEDISFYAKKERLLQTLSNVMVFTIVIPVIIFCIISLLMSSSYFYYIVMALITSVICLIAYLFCIFKYHKKEINDLAFVALYRKYLWKPELIDVDKITNSESKINSIKEIIISNHIGQKDSIVINNNERVVSFNISKIVGKKYRFEDIIKYEVVENGNSVVTGTAGQALVGGIFFGIGGAIVGSSMSKDVRGKCNNLSVIIYLNDVVVPTIEIVAVNKEIEKDSDVYKKAVLLVHEICSNLEYVINNKTIEDSLNNLTSSKKLDSDISMRDQIKELKEMMNEGLITKEEFEQKKKQILSI